MSGFLRPEVRALLWRWREALAAGGLGALGLWVALHRGGPVVQPFGWVLLVIAAGILFVAIRRILFAGSGQGPGVVGLVEGRVSYMGPFYGGSVALDDLSALSIRRAGDGKAYWVLAEGDNVLVIPVEARGADVLFDAFTRLGGLSGSRLIASLKATTPGTVTLWRRPGAAEHPALTR